MTPNPETMKFVANKLLYPGKSIDFPDETSAGPSPLAKELFAFPFIRSVFIASNFVTLSKTPDTQWDEVIPTVREFLKQYLQEGKTVINENEIVARPKGSNDVHNNCIGPLSGKEIFYFMGWRDRKWRVRNLALYSGISQEQIFEMWNRICTGAPLDILFKTDG